MRIVKLVSTVGGVRVDSTAVVKNEFDREALRYAHDRACGRIRDEQDGRSLVRG